MLANYQKDETGRLQSLTTYPLDKTKPTLELPEGFGMGALRDYVVRDGTLVLDPLAPAEPTAQEKIAALKAKLAATDYIAAKTADRFAGCADVSAMLDAAQDIRARYAQTLLARETWRQSIRTLEKQPDNSIEPTQGGV